MTTDTRHGWHPPVAVGVMRAWLALVIVEALLVTVYFVLSPARITELRYLVYPFVWINAGLWAVRRTAPTPSTRAHWTLAAGVGIAYFLVLMAVPGNIGIADPGTPVSVRVGWYAPGWGPLLAVAGPVRLYLVPFEVVGYAALAYLVYGAVLDLARAAVPGLLGVITCVGCTVPVLAPLVGLLGGPATGLVTTAYAYSYDIGTAVFLVTIVSLVWLRARRIDPGDGPTGI